MTIFQTDLSRVTSAGYSILRGPGVGRLRRGQVIAVTDDDADVLEAEVIAVSDDEADIRVRWDRVLRSA